MVVSTSCCKCEPSTSRGIHHIATAFDARGCSHHECRVPQLLPPAPLPQHEHAEHHDATTAFGSHTRAHCRYLHTAHAAHSIDTPLLSQAAEHDREASPLRARAAVSASLPLAEAASALPLHSLHEGAATTSAECLTCS